MNAQPSDRDEYHFGHDPEAGMLARMRQWTDVLPWLRLVRTLRAAGSPTLILIVAVSMAVWRPILTAILVTPSSGGEMEAVGDPIAMVSGLTPPAIASAVAEFNSAILPTSLFEFATDRNHSIPWYRWLAGIVWSLLVWTPVGMLLMRQGALLTADRAMLGARQGGLASLRRAWLGWQIAVVPLACAVTLALLMLVPGWLARMSWLGWLEGVLAMIVIAVAIPCGILVFGASFAVPLGWAAAINERDPDSLDCLSRGYEYLMRRPLHLVWYGLVSLVLLTVIGQLAAGIGVAADKVAITALEVAGAPDSLGIRVSSLLSYFPSVVVLALYWSLVGGVYLLLRYDAGGQEVEDIWIPSRMDDPLPQRE